MPSLTGVVVDLFTRVARNGVLKDDHFPHALVSFHFTTVEQVTRFVL